MRRTTTITTWIDHRKSNGIGCFVWWWANSGKVGAHREAGLGFGWAASAHQHRHRRCMSSWSFVWESICTTNFSQSPISGLLIALYWPLINCVDVSFSMKLMFTHKNRSLTPDLYIDGWRRHFTYFVDWTRQLEPFQRMKFSDRVWRFFYCQFFFSILWTDGVGQATNYSCRLASACVQFPIDWHRRNLFCKWCILWRARWKPFRRRNHFPVSVYRTIFLILLFQKKDCGLFWPTIVRPDSLSVQTIATNQSRLCWICIAKGHLTISRRGEQKKQLCL